MQGQLKQTFSIQEDVAFTLSEDNSGLDRRLYRTL